MDFLFSDFPPMRTGAPTFADTFYSLIPQTEKLDIAVGYVTADSLAELKQTVAMNNVAQLNLIIGMHYWDMFTEAEYRSAVALNDYLSSEKRGEVRLVTPFRFHGKMYSFTNAGKPFAGIIGSNNLISIFEGGNRVYEASVLFDDEEYTHKMNNFISELSRTSTENISALGIDKFKKANPLLENHEHVRKVENEEFAECITNYTNISFEIPIKATPKSNLNVFFGKGRESKNGLVKSRHWYEAELIVPKTITSQPGYPQERTEEAVFDVITDDGWIFKCKVSGDYSKNFRSDNDLKILGKWLKGRLENAGALSVGEPVTDETLQKYGRDTFTLIKTNKPNLWYIDFKAR